MIRRILVTGANGFIGKALCQVLSDKGYLVRASVRSAQTSIGLSVKTERIITGDIEEVMDWHNKLAAIETVIHLAARVHVVKDAAYNPLEEFRKVNVDGTERLAVESALNGVKRFIYLSSIGVNGNNNAKGVAFSEEDLPLPYDPYTLSKWEAEQVLRTVSQDTGLEIVIVRPPLVYGPNAPGNFARLLSLIKSGVPLPLGMIKNRRSFIYLDNLVGAIIKCIEHPDAAKQTLLVSDGQDVSTPDLIRMIANAMGKKTRLLPFPPAFLNVLGKIIGKKAEIERLTGSLQIDSSRIRNTLGWTPPFTLEEGISETVKWYVNTYENSGGRN